MTEGTDTEGTDTEGTDTEGTDTEGTEEINDIDREIVHNVCKFVEGPISEQECLFLYECAKGVENGIIVEIGAAKGRSTICLAMGCRESGFGIKVYSIDPHAGGMYTPDPTSDDVLSDGKPDEKYYTGQGLGKSIKKYLDNLNKFCVGDIVIPIIDYSELAYKNFDDGKGWNLPISLLWIDGDHRLNYVKKDIELWAKHVIPGGKILFHDYPFPGVCGAVEELILDKGKDRYCNFKGVGVEQIVNVTVNEDKLKELLKEKI
jgi:hypothetical protein